MSTSVADATCEVKDASHTGSDAFLYDTRCVSSRTNDADETAEIFADFDFTNVLRESIEQADFGNIRSWEEIKDEMGL